MSGSLRTAFLPRLTWSRFDAPVPLNFNVAPGTYFDSQAPAFGEAISQEAFDLVLVLAELVALAWRLGLLGLWYLGWAQRRAILKVTALGTWA